MISYVLQTGILKYCLYLNVHRNYIYIEPPFSFFAISFYIHVYYKSIRLNYVYKKDSN